MIKILDQGPKYALYALNEGDPDRRYMIMNNESRDQLLIMKEDVAPFEVRLNEARKQGLVRQFTEAYYDEFLAQMTANILANVVKD